MKTVLMVCLGNICRSPIAEAVFEKTIRDQGLAEEWQVDSAAIGSWHVGKRPDHRALLTLKANGIDYGGKARRIKEADFNNFDYIFGMDEENISDLQSKAPEGCKAKILLLGDFGLDKNNRIIRDPYYDKGAEGFKRCYEQCVTACEFFLNEAKNGRV